MGLDSGHNLAFGIVSHEMSETTMRGVFATESPQHRNFGKHGIY